MPTCRLQPEDYKLGWVCSLPIELKAATDMLNEEHHNLPHNANHPNLYTLGSVSGHNIAIVCLPAGRIGTNSAAVVVGQMKSKFPYIECFLLVGIGGGVPNSDTDIRLGDVVVSQPNLTCSGVVQYDLGKSTPFGFTRTGSLNSPPALLLSAVSKLQSNHSAYRTKLSETLSSFRGLHDNTGPDLLFEPTYNHVGGPECYLCSEERLVYRMPRVTPGVMVHYGTIASGNQVIRDGVIRDKLSSELDSVLCFEMEAAGLMNSFPCLVIRGICDYADSHKNKKWQAYAATAAAVYAKEVLSVIPSPELVEWSTRRHPVMAEHESRGIPIRHGNQYQSVASEFISNNLIKFYDQDPAFLEGLVETAAARAQRATEELGLGPEFIPRLTKLALYDFVLLCDDSASMKTGNRIPALQETIKRVAEFAIHLEPSGMSIRFLNLEQVHNFNNLTDTNDILQKIRMINYDGNTRLGQRLQSEIVGPMIMEKVKSNALRKPVIVAVITDGEPIGEPPTSLGNTIWRCKRTVRKLGYAAVVFLLCRVGDSDEAEEYLNKLEKDEKLKDLIYISPERIDEHLAIFERCQDDHGYRNWLLELFLTALDSVTR